MADGLFKELCLSVAGSMSSRAALKEGGAFVPPSVPSAMREGDRATVMGGLEKTLQNAFSEGKNFETMRASGEYYATMMALRAVGETFRPRVDRIASSLALSDGMGRSGFDRYSSPGEYVGSVKVEAS